jgi:hypothetical protein
VIFLQHYHSEHWWPDIVKLAHNFINIVNAKYNTDSLMLDIARFNKIQKIYYIEKKNFLYGIND